MNYGFLFIVYLNSGLEDSDRDVRKDIWKYIEKFYRLVRI